MLSNRAAVRMFLPERAGESAHLTVATRAGTGTITTTSKPTGRPPDPVYPWTVT
jgi:hypothetical protein